MSLGRNLVRASILLCPFPLCCLVNGQWDDGACGALFTEDRYALMHRRFQEVLKMSGCTRTRSHSRAWKLPGEMICSPKQKCTATLVKREWGCKKQRTGCLFDWCEWSESLCKGENTRRHLVRVPWKDWSLKAGYWVKRNWHLPTALWYPGRKKGEFRLVSKKLCLRCILLLLYVGVIRTRKWGDATGVLTIKCLCYIKKIYLFIEKQYLV